MQLCVTFIQTHIKNWMRDFLKGGVQCFSLWSSLTQIRLMTNKEEDHVQAWLCVLEEHR